jgi:hypothetical protein
MCKCKVCLLYEMTVAMFTILGFFCLQFNGEPCPHSQELKDSWDPMEKSRIKEFEAYVKHKVEKEKLELYKIVKEKVVGNTVLIGEGAHRQVKARWLFCLERMLLLAIAIAGDWLLCRRSARVK